MRCGVRATSDTAHLDGLPVERVRLDLRDRADATQALKNVDVVVHAAGITRARSEDEYRAVNAEGTRTVAAAAAEAGVGRFVFVSSLAARGPDPPNAADGVDRPSSAYGRSKLEAEILLRAFGDRMETVALRPAAVYGPRDGDLLPLFKLAARTGWLVIPGGRRGLQPVYAEDAARAALAAATRPVGFGPFPVAEVTRYSWEDVAAALGSALGRRLRAVRLPTAAFLLAGQVGEKAAKLRGAVPFFDARRARDLAVHAWTCDVSGTEKALDWRAEVPLPEGLKRTVGWYRRAGWI